MRTIKKVTAIPKDVPPEDTLNYLLLSSIIDAIIADMQKRGITNFLVYLMTVIAEYKAEQEELRMEQSYYQFRRNTYGNRKRKILSTKN